MNEALIVFACSAVLGLSLCVLAGWDLAHGDSWWGVWFALIGAANVGVACAGFAVI